MFSLIFIPWIVIYPVDSATTEAQGRVAKNILRLRELVTIISKEYRKIPKISPGAYIFQRPFFEGLIFGGAYLRREICVSKSIGLAL